MLVKEARHKGFSYQIMLNVGDWGEHTHMFRIDTEYGFKTGYYSSALEAEEAIRAAIDGFVNLSICSETDLFAELENCLIWTGYEDCNLNKDRALATVKKWTDFLLTKGVK